MWVPSRTFELFSISKDTVDALRVELAEARAEAALLRTQLLQAQTNFNWITIRVNALEVERAALIQKVHGISVATPEIIRGPSRHQLEDAINTDIFSDMGDDRAKENGLPVWSTPGQFNN